MNEWTVTWIATGHCPLDEPKGCIECRHFCGIKKSIRDTYVVECGVEPKTRSHEQQF